MSFYIVSMKIISIYALVLCIIGALGNIFTIFLVSRTSLKDTTTFIFLGFLAFTDMASLYFWNLDHFLIPNGLVNRQRLSPISCSTNIYFQFTFLQASAYLLVVLSFDRYLFVRFSSWNKDYLTPRKSVFVALAVIGLFFIVNLNVVFTFGIEYTVNGTKKAQCFYTPLVPASIWSNYWRTVFSVLYSLVPFILLIIASALLIYEIQKKSSGRSVTVSQNRNDSQRALNKTVVSVTITYIVMTTPVAVVTSFLNSFLQSSGETGDLIINICDSFSFSFHAFNFLVLYLTNKRYSKEVRAFFNIKDSPRANTNTNTSTTNAIANRTTNVK